MTFTTAELLGAVGIIPTSYLALPQDVCAGDRILMDDGLLELQVEAVSGGEVRCLVVVGGVLKDRKGINLPGVAVSAPALTDKGLIDLAFCIEQKLGYVALSFVRSGTGQRAWSCSVMRWPATRD